MHSVHIRYLIKPSHLLNKSPFPLFFFLSFPLTAAYTVHLYTKKIFRHSITDGHLNYFLFFFDHTTAAINTDNFISIG